MERCKRNSLNLACPVWAQQESALLRWIDRLMVLDYCRAVALWHQPNTFNHHAPSCAGAFFQSSATHVGSCAVFGPASSIIQYAHTGGERFPYSLMIWAVSAKHSELKTSRSRIQFLDITQHHRAWIRGRINPSKGVTPRMYLIISQVRELPTLWSFR